ncbi:MAG: hypothetical protein QXY49_00165 [Thermofilaceae archaeon]
MLIEYPEYGGIPRAYVDRGLRIWVHGRVIQPMHLPESLTPPHLLERGFGTLLHESNGF